MTDLAYKIAMAGNIIWLGMALRYFGFKHYASAKVMVPQSARSSPLFDTVAAGTRFLGGMNGAVALLALFAFLFVVSGSPLFADPAERLTLLGVFAAVHFSQFIFNVPVHLAGGRLGERYWNVTSGPMLFIFVVDAVMTLVNLVAGAILLAN